MGSEAACLLLVEFVTRGLLSWWTLTGGSFTHLSCGHVNPWIGSVLGSFGINALDRKSH